MRVVKRTSGSRFTWPFTGRRRLVRDYYIISVLLICGGLVTSGLIEIYFRFFESQEEIAHLQQEVAKGAAFKMEQFVLEIERTMRAAAKSRELIVNGLSPKYRFELRRLLSIAPPITDAVAIDLDGLGRVEVSRLRTILPDEKRDLSASEGYQKARKGKAYFGPVYFVRGSEPHMTIAVPIEPFAGNVAGVLLASVNLKYIWDVVLGIKIGKAGYAYAVTRSGNLIAHPDISLVLQQRNLFELEQVKHAFPDTGPKGDTAKKTVWKNLYGDSVLSSSAYLPSLDWAVIVEQPVEEAYENLYASLFRTSGLLLLAFATALVASHFLARRVVRPLRVLRQGVERIGAGDLGFRLEMNTGTEIDVLAEEFNKMTAAVQESQHSLEEKVEERTKELSEARERLEEWNRTLEEKVQEQVEEIERMGRFKRYLPPQIAEAVLKSEGDDDLFKTHRREVTVVFIDLRGFTNFSDSAEPEEVIDFLKAYHAELGRLIFEFEGTLEHFAGDGIMVFFNDPIPKENHTEMAIRMALAIQGRVGELRPDWLRRGYDLHVGIGLVAGIATLGTIGFEGRMEYAAIGNVANLASRLSSEAKGGQIVTDQRTIRKIGDLVEAKPLGEFELKGFARKVTGYEVLRFKE